VSVGAAVLRAGMNIDFQILIEGCAVVKNTLKNKNLVRMFNSPVFFSTYEIVIFHPF
jgi:hypothetical protein